MTFYSYTVKEYTFE